MVRYAQKLSGIQQGRQFALAFILVLMTLTPVQLYGQERVIITGKVVNLQGEGIGYAHIISLKTNAAMAADPSGRFSCMAIPGDSILVTAISMHPATFTVPVEVKPGNHPVLITLLPDTITLSGVTITPWPETWAEFRQAFVQLPLAEALPDLSIPPESLTRAIREASPKGGIFIPGPVSILYEAFSKEAKNRRKYEALTMRDQTIRFVRSRLGDNTILAISGCQHIMEAIELLEYCEPSWPRLDAASDLEILQAVVACLGNHERK